MHDHGTTRLLSVRQVAAMLQCSGWKVRAMYHSGQIAGLRIGRLLRLDASSVERLVETGLADAAANAARDATNTAH